MSNENWPQPPSMGGEGPPPGMGSGALGDWQPPRLGEDAADDGGKKKRKKKRKKKGKDGDGETTRGVANRRRIAAVGLALLTGALLFFASGEEPVEESFVARADRPIGALTELEESMVGADALPLELIEEGAYTGETAEEAIAAAMEALAGQRTQYPVAKGEQLHAEDFLLEARLAPDIGPDERLISLSASIAGAVGGDLRVGDHVDIIGVGQDLSRVMVNNAEVVDITLPEDEFGSFAASQTDEEGRDTSRAELIPGDPIPGVYTLLVAAEDAPRLLTVGSLGEILLVYRAPGADDIEPRTLPLDLLLCGLERPGLTEAELALVPDACRDSEGEVIYPFDEVAGSGQDFPLDGDLPEEEPVEPTDTSEAGQSEG